MNYHVVQIFCIVAFMYLVVHLAADEIDRFLDDRVRELVQPSGTKPHLARTMVSDAYVVMIGKSCDGAALYVGSKSMLPEENFALKCRSIVLLSMVMV